MVKAKTAETRDGGIGPTKETSRRTSREVDHREIVFVTQDESIPNCNGGDSAFCECSDEIYSRDDDDLECF